MQRRSAVGVHIQQPDMPTPAPSDTYIAQGAPGSPLVVGAGGCEGLLPALGACVHHPLLPQTGLQSFICGQQLKGSGHHLKHNQIVVLASFSMKTVIEMVQNCYVRELTAASCVFSDSFSFLVSPICSILSFM